ncbi:hypothetical protein Sjap_013201 [Stephania japonica]|uniref:Uncharacterized protein n=1 Tax=Stephania japonica TaxID=461633 RepID=A0AAP0IXJ9_9MAGN
MTLDLSFSKHHSTALAGGYATYNPKFAKFRNLSYYAILEHLMDLKKLSPQPVSDSEETVNAAILESVEFYEFSIVDEYLSEAEEILDVSLHELNITIAKSTYDEVDKDIEVVSERLDDPQKENKEDQHLVLVKPPTLLCIYVRPYKRLDVKERSRIFNTVDTFVLANHDLTDSFVLEVLDELLNLKEGVILDEHLRHLEHPLGSTSYFELSWDISNLSRRISGGALSGPKTLDLIPSFC